MKADQLYVKKQRFRSGINFSVLKLIRLWNKPPEKITEPHQRRD